MSEETEDQRYCREAPVKAVVNTDVEPHSPEYEVYRVQANELAAYLIFIDGLLNVLPQTDLMQPMKDARTALREAYLNYGRDQWQQELKRKAERDGN